MSGLLVAPTEQDWAWREGLAWAAGFFDGEGTFTASYDKRGGHVTCRITLPQKNPELLEQFTEVLGVGGGVSIHKDSNVYRLQIYTFEKVQAVVAMLWCFLGTDKQNQAVAMLERMNQYQQKDRVWKKRGPKVCVVSGCERSVQARGFCNTHYWHWWKENH